MAKPRALRGRGFRRHPGEHASAREGRLASAGGRGPDRTGRFPGCPSANRRHADGSNRAGNRAPASGGGQRSRRRPGAGPHGEHRLRLHHPRNTRRSRRTAGARPAEGRRFREPVRRRARPNRDGGCRKARRGRATSRSRARRSEAGETPARGHHGDAASGDVVLRPPRPLPERNSRRQPDDGAHGVPGPAGRRDEDDRGNPRNDQPDLPRSGAASGGRGGRDRGSGGAARKPPPLPGHGGLPQFRHRELRRAALGLCPGRRGGNRRSPARGVDSRLEGERRFDPRGARRLWSAAKLFRNDRLRPGPFRIGRIEPADPLRHSEQLSAPDPAGAHSRDALRGRPLFSLGVERPRFSDPNARPRVRLPEVRPDGLSRGAFSGRKRRSRGPEDSRHPRGRELDLDGRSVSETGGEAGGRQCPAGPCGGEAGRTSRRRPCAERPIQRRRDARRLEAPEAPDPRGEKSCGRGH